MGFFTALTDAMSSRQSLLVTGLDPNPEMLRSWAANRGLGGSSLLSQARSWCKSVIDATSDHVCAYKPSLGFYQAMGSAGVELLLEVRELLAGGRAGWRSVGREGYRIHILTTKNAY